MTNLSYGQNVVYFLNDLAASEVSDITSGEFESYGEDGQGRDASCSIDITLLAADAVSMIAALQEQVQQLAAHLHNIALTGTETLSGPDEYPDDREKWYRDGVSEIVSLAKNADTDAVIREIGAKAVDLSECRTIWYEHDDLSSEVECIPVMDIKKAIRAAGYQVEGE